MDPVSLARYRPMLAENRPGRLPAGRADRRAEDRRLEFRHHIGDGTVTVNTRTARDITAQTRNSPGSPMPLGQRCI